MKEQNDPIKESLIVSIENKKSLSAEQLTSILTNKEDVEACQAEFKAKLAVVQRQKLLTPNVQEEWQKFLCQKETPHRRRMHRKRLYVWGAIAVACSILILVCYPLIKNPHASEMIFVSNTQTDKISIQAENGKELLLSSVSDGCALDSIVRANGMEDTEAIRVKTPRMHTYSFRLPDGSKVWLNAESRLMYSASFKSNRKVTLSGEAYFQVTSDSAHPFVVQTNTLQTKVLGTQFNIRNYSPTDTHVTLVKGSVEVSDASHTVKLHPGDDAQLMTDGALQVQSVDVNSFVSWKDGYFYYDQISLREVLCELGRWYNVSVRVENQKACSQRLHFFANRRGSLQEALDLLNNLGVAKIKKEGNCVVIR